MIDWVMKTQGVSFRHGVELLKVGNAGLLAASDKPVRRNTTHKHPEPLAVNPDKQATLKRVINYYHESLKQKTYSSRRPTADFRMMAAAVVLISRGLN